MADHVPIQQVWAGACLTDTPRGLALGPRLSGLALSAALKAGTQQRQNQTEELALGDLSF